MLSSHVLAASAAPAQGTTTGSSTGGVQPVPTAPTTVTTTTATTATTRTTTTRPRPVPPRGPVTLRPGVRVAGIDVGGLEPREAVRVVRAAFDKPLVLVHRRARVSVSPRAVGGVAYVARAVDRARRAPAGTNVRLGVAVRRARTRSYVGRLARRFDRRAVDATLSLRGVRPRITLEKPGRALERQRAVKAIVRALETHTRGPVRLSTRPVRPRLTRASFGPVIVIRRGSKRLYLYDGDRLRRTFGVATGLAEYPTPLGSFTIVVKWRNPWWYPPDSPWAAGKSPVPPGPGNPLGTRWMGLSVSGVGIHGTPDAASIGYSASHGCIRMRISEAEWLFDHVEIGTPVFIVSA